MEIYDIIYISIETYTISKSKFQFIKSNLFRRVQMMNLVVQKIFNLSTKSSSVDEQLTDQFIIGLYSEKCRHVLINNDPKDNQSCYQLVVNMEISDHESKVFSSHDNQI